MKTAALGFVTYLVVASFAFGDPLTPIAYATFWSGRLGAPYWFWIVCACFAVGEIGFLLPSRFSLLRGPIFVAVGLLGSLLTVGAYADHLRTKALDEFGADRLIQHSFSESVRNPHEEFHFFLHAAAMKDCVPYGWSYRTMSVYRLPPRAAINVMPETWLEECSIDRESLGL